MPAKVGATRVEVEGAGPGTPKGGPKLAFADEERPAADPGPPSKDDGPAGEEGPPVGRRLSQMSRVSASLLVPLLWLDSRTRGLSGFICMISLLSIGTCALAFVALPISNPLTHDNWWQCSLACTLVWVPLSITYIGQLLDHMLYRPLGQSLPIRHIFIMWFVQSACMSGVMILLAVCWANPAPLNGAIGATVGIVMNALIIYFIFVPILADSVGIKYTACLARSSGELWQIKKAAISVLVFFVAAVMQLMAMLTISAFLLWADRWYLSAPLLPIVRLLYTKILGTLAQYMRHDARPLGQSMASISVGIALAIAVGSASSWRYTLLIFVVDLSELFLGALSIAHVERRGCYISELLLLRHMFFKQVCVRRRSIRGLHDEVTADVKAQARHRMITFLLSAEMGELIVAMNFSLCWFIIRVGPNSGAFSGNGTSDFGLQVPPNTWDFVGNIVILFLAEAISFVILKDVLSRCFGVDLHEELRKLLAEYGPILAAQSAWIVVTSFCMTMIHCGLDYSLSWSYM